MSDRTNILIGIGIGTLIGYLLGVVSKDEGPPKITPTTKKLTIESFNSLMGKLNKHFDLSLTKKIEVKNGMIAAFEKGLTTEGGDIAMLPTFVTQLPTGDEQGEYLALDLGGSNFRVLKFNLKGDGTVESTGKKYTIPDAIKKSTAEDLFALIAECVLDFVPESINGNQEYKLGFTFSFAVHQTGIASGYLIKWTKGFSASGVEGNDVVELLQNALNAKNANVKVAALVNDTTATMMACALKTVYCNAGLIIGTGTNICYTETIENIKKWKGDIPESRKMLINTEWGAFDDSRGGILPITKYDELVDLNTPNVGHQKYEKMISGMYLGELTRLICKDLINSRLLFEGRSSDAFDTPWGFDTAYMSAIEKDESSGLDGIRQVLQQKLELKFRPTFSDCLVIQKVSEVVAKRAATLAACGVAATVEKMGRVDKCVVAVDGSVFQHYPSFEKNMKFTLNELYDSHGIEFWPSPAGSGSGAAVVAATSCQ